MARVETRKRQTLPSMIARNRLNVRFEFSPSDAGGFNTNAAKIFGFTASDSELPTLVFCL